MSTELATVRLNSPATFAEALPYLLGYRPQNSLVIAVIHEGRLSFAARLDLPASESDWFDFATDSTSEITTALASKNLPAPDEVVLYLIDDPASGQTGQAVAVRLAPLARLCGAAFTHHRIPTQLALCVSANQWWDLSHEPVPGPGTALPGNTPGPTTVAFTVAGQLPAPSETDLTATLAPLTGDAADALGPALLAATPALGHDADPSDTHARLEHAATAFADPSTTSLPPADTAALLYALIDRLTRDWAMSLPETHTNPAARRLFTYLATAAVDSYEVLACAPLTLLAVSAWYDGDQALARVALRRACHLDPSSRLPAMLRAAFNMPISTDGLKSVARAGRND
ncbi:DUF4192 domain-containing protein [Streptomyces sp. NPDC001941]|uniref:DUF4192 domain-containing protein n=1 Tax=Streptomyces sp. NPDC001941 TaxID=3154659 RepID=UPI00331DAAC0